MSGSSFGFLRSLFGVRAIVVESESLDALVLRYGSTRTVFERASSRVVQNGQLVGLFSLVERVQLHRPRGQEGHVNWFITIQLKGARQVEVGQSTDQTDASLIGARISTVTGCPVVVQP